VEVNAAKTDVGEAMAVIGDGKQLAALGLGNGGNAVRHLAGGGVKQTLGVVSGADRTDAKEQQCKNNLKFGTERNYHKEIEIN